ncbi:MAG: acetyltransferase [Gammaproteobacteria bacterium]
MNDAKLSLTLAEVVRVACLEAAREGYESAALSGLCHEGAMEASLDAIRALDLKTILAAHVATPQKKP